MSALMWRLAVAMAAMFTELFAMEILEAQAVQASLLSLMSLMSLDESLLCRLMNRPVLRSNRQCTVVRHATVAVASLATIVVRNYHRVRGRSVMVSFLSDYGTRDIH